MGAAIFFILTAAALSLVMTLAWLLVLRGAKSGWVDTIWSFLVGAAGVFAALVPVADWDGVFLRQLAVAIAALLWSCRLGFHILQRTRTGGEDPRYAKLREEWGEGWRL